MKRESYNTKKIYILLAVLIGVQLISIIYYFQFWKEGYHSDEIWSYGYANSYNMKDIFQDAEGNDTYVNEWYDTQILRDYIVVNEGEQFEYGSIYNNQIRDLSPPFHSMVLHTICSFFPEQYSRWFSFSINIVSFLVTMIFLFKIVKMLKNDMFALCCCAVYGFSLGARDTYIYLRMYAMCTALIMVAIYSILRYFQKYRESRKLFQKELLVIGSVSLIGFLTHYYVVSFMGILTFFLCVLCFFKREYKLTFVFGFFMLAVFILSVVIFPSMFQVAEGKVDAEIASSDYDFRTRVMLLCYYIMKKLFNVTISVYPTGFFKIAIGVMVFVLVMCIPLGYLLRDTKWMKRFIKYSKIFLLHPWRTLRYLERRINWIYVVLFMTIIGQIIVVGETANVYSMGTAVDRYLFYVLPLAVVVVMVLLYQVITIVLRKKKWSQIILLAICIITVGMNCYNCICYIDYSFMRFSNEKFEDIVENKNCLYIREESWILTTLVPTLMYGDTFSQVSYNELQNIEQLYGEKKDEEVIVILDAALKDSAEGIINANLGLDVERKSKNNEMNELYDKIIKKLEDLDPETEMKNLGIQCIQGRVMEVYLVNP